MKPQHTEAAFRRYEKIIDTGVRLYPYTYKPIRDSLNSQGLPPSGVTCAARCRDAINSLLLHNWTTYINVDRLREIRSDFAIAQLGTSIILGPRKDVRATSEYAPQSDATKEMLAQKQKTVERKQTGVIEYHSAIPDELHSILDIAKLGGLKSPIEIDVTDEEAARLEQSHETPIAKRPNGFYWILP